MGNASTLQPNEQADTDLLRLFTKNSASVGLDILANLMDDMHIKKLEIVKNDDTLNIKVPTNATNKKD